MIDKIKRDQTLCYLTCIYFASKYNLEDAYISITKDKQIITFINCNDFFYWGCADDEILNIDNLDLLKKSIYDCLKVNSKLGFLLFCSRVRGMRPQGACYGYIDAGVHHLFDEAGPNRDNDVGNTSRSYPSNNFDTIVNSINNNIVEDNIKFDENFIEQCYYKIIENDPNNTYGLEIKDSEYRLYYYGDNDEKIFL
mgnify:CR=1 FL=1